MKKIVMSVLFMMILNLAYLNSFAQVPVKVANGKVFINDGSLTYKKDKYAALTDTLTRKLKANPADTTSLFYKALLCDLLNNQMAVPAASDKDALTSLERSKYLCEKAINFHMRDFRVKVLRAQIYKDLAYRFSGDEAWKYNNKQISERRDMFNVYKDLANKYYDELAALDAANAVDYQKLKVTFNYPIR